LKHINFLEWGRVACFNGNLLLGLSTLLPFASLDQSKRKMSNKLYVGNLSFRVTSEDLQEHFGAAGAVESANVVYDRETGRSRGFGFVEMASDDEANAAIAQFNGQEYDGRNMVVNEARPREDRGNGGGYRAGRGGGGGGGGYGHSDRW
jgi:RNA recognition motif-containing protein